MNAVIQLCEQKYVNDINYDIFMNFSDHSIFDLLREMSPKFEDSVLHCAWLYQSDDCKVDFKTIITEEGICFTFNALNSRDVYTDVYDF